MPSSCASCALISFTLSTIRTLHIIHIICKLSSQFTLSFRCTLLYQGLCLSYITCFEKTEGPLSHTFRATQNNSTQFWSFCFCFVLSFTFHWQIYHVAGISSNKAKNSYICYLCIHTNIDVLENISLCTTKSLVSCKEKLQNMCKMLVKYFSSLVFSYEP